MALPLVGLALLGLSALLFVLPRSASATTNGITVAAGLPSPFATDGTPASPEVNITSLSDLYQDGQITLTLQTADPVDPTATGSSFFVNWGIWTNGNSDPTKLNFVVQFANGGVGTDATQILGANSQVEQCTPSATFANERFSIEFPASCIGSPTSIEVAALTETLASTSDIPIDLAPSNSTACCEATDTVSTTPTSTTSATTTATTTLAGSTTTSSTTTPSSTTTTTTTTNTNTTTTTSPSSTVPTSTTTTSPVTLAGSSGGSSGSAGSTAAASGVDEASASSSLAFTGISSAALRWLLLFGGLFVLAGSLGRRAALRRTARRGLLAVGSSDHDHRGGTRTVLLLVLLVSATTVAAVHASGTTPTTAGPSAASLVHAVSARPDMGPRLFGRSRPGSLGASVVSPAPGPATAESAESPNWSGYVITTGASAPITDIQGTWTVPNVALSWAPTDSASWIGIDGGTQGATDLAQEGTEQNSFYGFTEYAPWWSTSTQNFLAQAFPGPFTVTPGDVMTADVHQAAGGQLLFTLTDETTGQTQTENTTYQGSGLTAEWIVEAPSFLNQSGGLSVGTLADYGSTVFDALHINGASGSVGLTPAEEVLMNQNGTITSYPSQPSASGDAFTVAYGATQPLPPTGETPIISGSGLLRQSLFTAATPAERTLLPGTSIEP